MTTPPSLKLCGETQALVYPGGGAAYVFLQAPRPCITILVHGVNDLAGVYADIEQGICQGLTERLDHLTTKRGGPNLGALVPATYSLPTKDHSKPDPNSKLDPDAVYYRRKPGVAANGGPTRSVVIPFYWGFRESNARDKKGRGYIQKDKPHGEWLDRYGNRLDKAGTKEGGAFANATTTLPDMWGEGFNGKLIFGFLSANTLAGSPRHPLHPAPPRPYMLLAAQRLAMLIKIIRKQNPDDTINVVAHSQGTMLTLLANAFLSDEGQRPIDSAVLMNSPYSLQCPRMELAQGHGQQTAVARLGTLAGIVNFIGAQPNATPSMADMADPGKNSCIGGLRWTGAECVTTIDGIHQSFEERDNRGNVTLYFTPQDQTVGLLNIEGIGWQGVPDTPLSRLGPRFHQRVFTLRQREGHTEDVGAYAPSRTYVLRQKGEATWDGNGQGWFGNLIKAELTTGQSVTLNAPKLPSALVVNFDDNNTSTDNGSGQVVPASERHGIHMVEERMDPIDASIAVADGGWKPGDFAHGQLRAVPYTPGQTPADVQAAYNQDKVLSDQIMVRSVAPLGNGEACIVCSETPNEARERLMTTQPLSKDDALSFHSAIPANPEHSRKAVAYDLAIGQAWSLDNDAFYAYLCRVADWRLKWKARYSGGMAKIDAQKEAPEDLPDAATLAFYSAEDPTNRKLIDLTVNYHASGDPLPPDVANPALPTLIKSDPPLKPARPTT